MKKNKKCEKVSRKHLADPKLGMSYSERLKQTKIQVINGGFKIEEHGNGYASIKRMRLE